MMTHRRRRDTWYTDIFARSIDHLMIINLSISQIFTAENRADIGKHLKELLLLLDGSNDKWKEFVLQTISNCSTEGTPTSHDDHHGHCDDDGGDRLPIDRSLQSTHL